MYPYYAGGLLLLYEYTDQLAYGSQHYIYALSAEFSGSSMECIVTLTPEKREEILGLVSQLISHN